MVSWSLGHLLVELEQANAFKTEYFSMREKHALCCLSTLFGSSNGSRCFLCIHNNFEMVLAI